MDHVTFFHANSIWVTLEGHISLVTVMLPTRDVAELLAHDFAALPHLYAHKSGSVANCNLQCACSRTRRSAELIDSLPHAGCQGHPPVPPFPLLPLKLPDGPELRSVANCSWKFWWLRHPSIFPTPRCPVISALRHPHSLQRIVSPTAHPCFPEAVISPAMALTCLLVLEQLQAQPVMMFVLPQADMAYQFSTAHKSTVWHVTGRAWGLYAFCAHGLIRSGIAFARNVFVGKVKKTFSLCLIGRVIGCRRTTARHLLPCALVRGTYSTQP